MMIECEYQQFPIIADTSEALVGSQTNRFYALDRPHAGVLAGD